MTQAGWQHVPHLTEAAKEELLRSTMPYLRDARSQGKPALGAGAIYPIAEDDIRCSPFKIPDHWPRAYGMDVGWNRTAVIWAARDRSADIVYFYTEHYRAEAVPTIHAAAIKARGPWIPGVIDPASHGRSQEDGRQLIVSYTQGHGLKLTEADNSVESGLFEVFDRMQTGRLKVFSTLQNWWGEFRVYRRDEKGRIVKKYDHAMDAGRYVIVSGIDIMTTAPAFIGSTFETVGDSRVNY